MSKIPIETVFNTYEHTHEETASGLMVIFGMDYALLMVGIMMNEYTLLRTRNQIENHVFQTKYEYWGSVRDFINEQKDEINQ
jgi:hypothetical protein